MDKPYHFIELRPCPNKDFWDVYGVDEDGGRWLMGKEISHAMISTFFVLYATEAEEEKK